MPAETRPAKSNEPRPLRLLALDTATPRASVALCVGAEPLAEADAEVTTHSEGLVELIAGVLSQAGLSLAELDGLVCGQGPGSFTGLRIGLATVKGLCFAAAKPLLCVPTMVGVAGAAGAAHGAGAVVAVVLDARRDELFCGLYRDGEPAADEVVLRPEQLEGWVAEQAARQGVATAEVLLAGDGALRYREDLPAGLTVADEGCHAVRARYLAASAEAHLARGGSFDDLAAAAPSYLRPPDIRRPAVPPPPPPPGLDELLERSAPAPAAQASPATGPTEQLSDAERDELIERLRQTGLRLDREGRWWHLDQRVEHARLAAALHRWLDQLDDGRFVVRLDEQRYAYVTVDDAPYEVRTVEGVADGEGPVRLRLSDQTEEPLDPETLVVDPESDALYCRVKQGRFEARFSRPAQLLLAQLIEGDEDGESFLFVRGSLRACIGSRPGR